MIFLLFPVVFSMVTPVLSKDLGTHGHTYNITEADLLQQITQKLKKREEDGTITAHQKAVKHRIKKSFRRPLPVCGITHAIKSKTRYHDPSITISHDLKDQIGRVFQKAGTRINPLQYRSLTKPLVFIDGDDEAQVAWACSHKKARVVLIHGAPLELMETLDRPVFFDQGGTLSKKLGVQHVPARVSQAGLALKIEEIALRGTKQ